MVRVVRGFSSGRDCGEPIYTQSRLAILSPSCLVLFSSAVASYACSQGSIESLHFDWRNYSLLLVVVLVHWYLYANELDIPLSK